MYVTPSPLSEGAADLGLVTGCGTATSLQEATRQALEALRVDAAVKRCRAVYGVRFDLLATDGSTGVLTAVLASGIGTDYCPILPNSQSAQQGVHGAC